MSTALTVPALFPIAGTAWIIRPYTPDDAPAWDAFVAHCPMATWLHSRQFLAYHGERFIDCSLIIIDASDPNEERWLGVLPAAAWPNDPQTIISHPGATYGGLCHRGQLRGSDMITALEGINSYYKHHGASTFRYKLTPSLYHHTPMEDDRYALFQAVQRGHAHWGRSDLSATVELAQRLPWARPEWIKKRQKNMKQVQKHAIQLSWDKAHLPTLWAAIEANLTSRHEARPTHNLTELQQLMAWFPEHIQVLTGTYNDDFLGGLVLFLSHAGSAPPVAHVQYMAATPAAMSIAAMDALVEAAMTWAQDRGVRYFEFGHSNTTDTDGLWGLNDGLYRFKSKFGTGGICYDTIDITLSPDQKLF